jgi:phenylalanyl-tRNA synthetase beta chain
LDLDVDALADGTRATRRPEFAMMPSRYPSAVVDLALVTPTALNAQDLAYALSNASEFVEDVTLFDVYRGASLAPGTRSLAYSVRFSSDEHTLSDDDVSSAREALITRARELGATLR